MSKGRILAVSLIWLLIVAALAVVYRGIIVPYQRRGAVAGTSSSSRYRQEIHFALDSFSGYAILRSARFKEALAGKGLRLILEDDGADYAARLRAMQRGDVQMGVFTIDALLTASAELGDLPATIVAIVDETRGADAIVADREIIPNIDGLNHVDLRFVATRGSPSETLSRVVMSHFRLDALPAEPFIFVSGPDAVLERYRQSKPTDHLAYALWEPYVSRLLENPRMHVVTDSGAFRGYIVDVLVVNRDFLLKNEDIVRDVVGCYFQAAYDSKDAMAELLVTDARQRGENFSAEQAQRLVAKIWWKNTLENFAHFGIDHGGSLQLLEDMIANMTSVLRRTQALPADPTGGKPQSLYFDKILRDLQASDFHPRLSQEQLRSDGSAFVELSDAEWNSLVPIGTLAVPDLVFARGTSQLTEASKKVLDELGRELETFPTAYVLVRGNAALLGDPAANRRLAEQRATAVRAFLVQQGVAPQRLRSVGVEPQAGSTVSILLGRPAY